METPNYGLEVLNKLNSLRTKSCFTDAILCISHEEFPCHRNVLAASSPYFQAMFSCDLKEGKEARIVFNDVSPWTMKRVIEYAYTGHLEITVDNAQDMLAAGSMFQYPDIVEACCRFLTNHLHPSNCLGIEEFAHLHCCDELEGDSHKFVLDNFSTVVEFEEFVELPMARLNSYLSSDLIDVRSEETVYEAALRWVKHDLDNRKKQACQLMDRIRFATVDMEYLQETVHTESLITGCSHCSQLLQDARHYREKTDQHGPRRRSMREETYTPRPSTLAKEAVVLVGGIDSINYIMQSVEMYDPQKDKWNSLPDIPQASAWFSIAALNNNIYVCGGYIDGHIVRDVWQFDSGKRRWSEMPPMVTPRARHASTTWNGKVYVLGGISLSADANIVYVESVECFDPDSAQWFVVGQSPFPRKQSHLVPYQDTLVEVGGTQGDAQVNTMESYLCSDGKVQYSGEQFVLPDVAKYSNIVALNGIFYIIWEDSKRMISLNPAKRTFRRLADMHYAHHHSGATVLQGKIYITGGLVDSEPSRVVECYDPNTNTWSVVKSMRQPRACHGCVTIQMC